MKKILLLILLTLISRVASAEFARSTTFDDRDVCVKERGVWREYGNSLADNCEAKMDRFAIAAQVVTFSCDCGKNRCWNDEHCTSISDFRKIYEANQEKENKKIVQQKKKRAEQYKTLSNERIIALAKGAMEPEGQNSNSKDQQKSVSMGNNLSQFKDKFPKDDNVVVQTVNEIKSTPVTPAINAINQANEKIQEGALGKIFSLPENQQAQVPAANSANNTVITDVTGIVQGQPADPAAGPTPFFLQQQEKAKQNSTTSQNSTTTKTNSSSTSELGLPEIPLPQ